MTIEEIERLSYQEAERHPHWEWHYSKYLRSGRNVAGEPLAQFKQFLRNLEAISLERELQATAQSSRGLQAPVFGLLMDDKGRSVLKRYSEVVEAMEEWTIRPDVMPISFNQTDSEIQAHLARIDELKLPDQSGGDVLRAHHLRTAKIGLLDLGMRMEAVRERWDIRHTDTQEDDLASPRIAD